MNFFEHQDRARRQTRWLVLLFILAVTGIILAVNALVLAIFGVESLQSSASLGQFVTANGTTVAASTLITTSVIGLASLFRTLQLRGGGGEVARELGGTLVEPGTRDPLRRRLHNVVEEMAIASGIPVPEVYVLEHEQGINAFAAGFNTADAAVAVTRGTLEALNRDELQGVIAHEFSHIFNGDTRINIRLIGFLFGILVISIIGRKLLRTASYARDSRNAAPAVFIGLAVVVIGYLGLFFGRWIKAAVSRQREYLADASAVQFTRNPLGIGGALKKIAASYAGSFLTTDAEEVGHMLFSRGMGYQMFATHPPIEKRIKAIEPGFDPAELKVIARKMDRHAQARQAEAELDKRDAAASADRGERKGPGGLPLNPDQLAEQIGQPGLNQVFVAAALATAVPPVLERAAHSDEWSQEVICSLLLSANDDVREDQLLRIAQVLGGDSEAQVRALRQAMPDLERNLRLPLMEMAFPALRRRPQSELVRFMGLIDDLIQADGRVDVFEFALARLTARQIEDVLNPKRASPGGSKSLSKLSDQALDLLSIIAAHGHESEEAAVAALQAGQKALIDRTIDARPDLSEWTGRLDAALKSLDTLQLRDKKKLMAALVAVVMHDGQVLAQEYELVRVICGALHVPLPVLEEPASAS